MSRDSVGGPRVGGPAPASPVDGSETFTSWAGEHHRALLAFAQLVSGDASTAEDLVQIALARVFLKWARLGRPDEDPLAYVRRIIVNENTSLWRRAWKRRELPTADLPQRPDPATSSDPSEQTGRTWAAVQALPRGQRTAVALRYYADLSVADAAAAMGCTAGTVKTHTSRALATLKAQLSGGSSD